MKKETIFTAQSNKRFEQIYDYILNRIQRGDWKAHTKLPSIRGLAEEMEVHRLTVFKAYQLLKQNEIVYVKDKSGYYVHPGGIQVVKTEDTPIISYYIHENNLSEIHQMKAEFQFSQALIDPNLLPNLYMSEYVKKVFDLYPKVLSTYSTIQGDEELRKALCRYFIDQHQFYLSPDELLITSGAQQAIDLISRVLIKPRDVVLLERPTYSPAVDVYRHLGAQIIPVDIHAHGYDLEQIEMVMRTFRPRLFYLNPTFHNPTGYTVQSEQRKRLVELAEKYRCLLIEDDSYHDIYFGEEPPPPLFTYDTEGCVMYIRGFSKYVAPGLRIAAVACRQSVMKSLLTVKSLSDNGTPLLNQKIFLHYFLSTRLQQHVEKLRTALLIRKDIMEQELAETNWKWTTPTGGLNLWVQLPESISMDTLFRKSLEHSLTFIPGSVLDPKRESASWLRLSYSYLSESKIREGVKRLVRLSETFH